MPFNLDRFKSTINYGGALKASRYEAQITIPPCLTSKWNGFGESLMFRCEATRLPGLQFASADGPPRLGYGPIERHPYNVNYEEISMTFIMDAKTQVHNFFYDWCNCIFNFKGGGGKAAQEQSVYETGYKSSYSTTLTVAVYKDTGRTAMTAEFYQAFPMALPALPMNWNDGEIVKLTIPFTYLDFNITYTGTASGGGDAAAAAPQVERGIALNTAPTTALPSRNPRTGLA